MAPSQPSRPSPRRCQNTWSSTQGTSRDGSTSPPHSPSPCSSVFASTPGALTFHKRASGGRPLIQFFFYVYMYFTSFLSIQEILGREYFEPLQVLLPQRHDLVHLEARLNSRPHHLVSRQQIDPVPGPCLHPREACPSRWRGGLAGEHVVSCLDDLQGDPESIKLARRRTNRHLHSAAGLVRVLAHHRGEIGLPDPHAREAQAPQRVGKLPADVGRPDQLEGKGGPPPLAQIDPLDQAQAEVERHAVGGR
mmetsp:Transcript_6599/g.22751  ORF Transcript_6599/g.22751 Transcript_6599/m.22751 type:complete len:250 (-) Transcript_6599:969-1718(-)